MRGIPLIRLAIVIALFLLALIPLGKLTAEKVLPALAAPVASEIAKTVPTQIDVTGSPAATQFTILHLGKIVWQGTGDNASTTLALPEKPFDLQVQASWANNETRENALRVRVSRDDLPLADATFWGQTQIDDVLTIPAN